jgi:integrase
MGSVYEREDGRWEGKVTLPGGKRKSVYATSSKECVAKMQELLNDVRLGMPIPGKDQTLTTFLETWITDVIAPNRAASTTSNYRQLIRLYIIPSLGKRMLTKLTGQDIQRFENQLRQQAVRRTGQPMGERTIQLCHGILRASLNKAVKFGLIHRNPVLSVDPPKVRRVEVRPLNPDQARVLLQSVRGSRLEAFFTVAISLGVRPGEALGLTWDDVNWSLGTIFIHQQLQRNAEGRLAHADLKTERSRRVIHLPSITHRTRQLEERLKAWKWEDTDLIFCTSGDRQGSVGGRPLQHRNVYRLLQSELEKAGLPHQRLYDLRHLAASLLLVQGASMREVMEVLGHSQMSLTSDTYSHVFEASGKANAERMNNILSSMA